MVLQEIPLVLRLECVELSWRVVSDEQVKVFAVKSCVIVLALVVFNFEGLLETKVIR